MVLEAVVVEACVVVECAVGWLWVVLFSVELVEETAVDVVEVVVMPRVVEDVVRAAVVVEVVIEPAVVEPLGSFVVFMGGTVV